VGVVALGDGSARRSEKAPGYVDPRAAAHDADVAAALAGGDAEGLLLHDEAPYGVGYLVALWHRAGG
jgi:hypothetical protein